MQVCKSDETPEQRCTTLVGATRVTAGVQLDSLSNRKLRITARPLLR